LEGKITGYSPAGATMELAIDPTCMQEWYQFRIARTCDHVLTLPREGQILNESNLKSD
jgi:hypothetical protein